jgi:hypothetical protein
MIGSDIFTDWQNMWQSTEDFLGKLNRTDPIIREAIERRYQSMQGLPALFRQAALFHRNDEALQKRVKDLINLYSPQSTVTYVLGGIVENMLQKIGHEHAVAMNARQPCTLLYGIFVFHLAHEIIGRKEYDLGLIVGDEAYPIAPIFELLKLPLVNVWVDEHTEERPFRALDDLSILSGKKVLIVEDDVRAGRTLERVVGKIADFKPEKLGLFLSLPLRRQKLENVPKEISASYTTHENISCEEEASTVMNLAQLLNQRFRIFV